MQSYAVNCVSSTATNRTQKTKQRTSSPVIATAYKFYVQTIIHFLISFEFIRMQIDFIANRMHMYCTLRVHRSMDFILFEWMGKISVECNLQNSKNWISLVWTQNPSNNWSNLACARKLQNTHAHAQTHTHTRWAIEFCDFCWLNSRRSCSSRRRRRAEDRFKLELCISSMCAHCTRTG